MHLSPFCRIIVLLPLGLSSVALADGLDKLQADFAATTKDLVQNMRIAADSAPQCSFFGGAIASALAEPIAAIPPGAARVDSSLTKFKTSVAAIGIAPVEGVDISAGAAQAVKAKQAQINAAAAAPEAVIDGVSPVVSQGLQKMQDNYSRVMGMLQGSSPACQKGAGAFRQVYSESVVAQGQLKAMRSAIEAQKAALTRWNSGVQTRLGAN